jgi:16S rRNA (uracil1498-N3)-methyltransferase
VLRLGPGDPVMAFDGHGLEVAGILAFDEGRLVVETQGPPTRMPSRPPIHIILSIARGPAMDDAMRVATECGATDIHLMRTQRSAPTGDRSKRWLRKISAAAEQCQRATVPTLHPPSPLLSIVSDLTVPLWIACPGETTPPTAGAGAIVIGPEGGLTADEVHSVLQAGGKPCSLGTHVLRVATAVAVGAALLSLSSEGRAG